MPRTVPLPLALLMTRFEPGGTERQMIELVRRLDPTRWAVHLACFERRGEWFAAAAEAAVSVTEFPVRSFRRFSLAAQVAAFARWCRARRIAVAHTTCLWTNSFGLPAAALAGVPARIGNRRELNPDKTAAQIAIQRAAYSCAHQVVANSRAAAAQLTAERVPTAKIAIVPNGIDFDRVVPRTPRPRLRTAVVVANLRREKGHDVLIDAAPGVLQRVPDARFDVVGNGPELPALLARAEARGVRHAFNFLGHCNDVAARLAEGDIFVLPSRSEAFPNAVLEAMAAGQPIVASRVGGICELIDDGRTGLLTPAGDAGALADRIVGLLSDPPLAARLGQAAREEALARYSFDRMVDAFERIYLNQLTRRGLLTTEQPRLAAS